MMKKILTLIVLVVAMATPSQAQFKFGLKGGLNLTSMSFSESGVKDAVSNKAGFFVGPTVKFTVPIVGLSLDVAALYDQRSAEDKDSGTKIKQQSIQVPINVRYGIGLSSLVNIFAFAGPQFGFNIGDKNQELSKTVSEVKNWTLRSSNLSANVGLGVTVLGHLQVTANYNIAFGKTGEFETFDVAKGVWETVSGGRSNAWQIAAAYYF